MHREIVEGKTTVAIYVALAVFFTFLLGRGERLWPTMVGAILGPLLSALVLTLKPLNPYEGNMFAKKQGISFRNVQNVTGAQALVDLLKSRAACAYTTRLAAILALAFMILLPLVWMAFGGKVSTARHSDVPDQVIGSSFMFGVSSFGVEAMLLLRWAVQRVRQQEFPEL